MSQEISNQHIQTESLTHKTFGFWFLILGSIILTQVVRIIILDKGLNVFLNDKFAFSLNIPSSISYTLYFFVFVFIIRHLYLYWHEIHSTPRIGLLLVLSGGVSNLIERLWFGHVVDYIFILNGVMNLADIYIIVGAIMLLVSQVHKRE